MTLLIGLLCGRLYSSYDNTNVYVSKYVSNSLVSKDFKIPIGLERAVDFWINVYSKYDVNHVLVHDTDNYIIYSIIDISDVSSMDDFSNEIKDEIINSRVNIVKNQYRSMLKNIHETISSGGKLESSLENIYDKFNGVPGDNKFLEASRPGRIRAQKGQSSSFKEGLFYSQLYMGEMEKIFAEKGLPLELARLPYVESYFNPRAVSHKSATGIWQFMRRTGAEYMRVSHIYDERKDPITSTKAAAKLLKQSYEYLWRDWPLAVTAYNHGRFGMKKAANRSGTKDLVRIVKSYSTDSFGFASKNFYAEFLAALYIDLNKKSFFSDIEANKPLDLGFVTLVKPLRISQIELLLDVDKDKIRRYNPAVSEGAFERDDLIPAGARIGVPSQKAKKLLSETENTRSVTNYVKVM